jgi:hypothetical protein
MSDESLRKLITEQRKRAVAGIMGSAERSEWWDKLNRPEQLAFRDKVLTSIGVFHDLVLDVVKVNTEGTDMVWNEHALEILQAIRSLETKVGLDG